MFDSPAGSISRSRQRGFRAALDRFLARVRTGGPLLVRYPDGTETRAGGDSGPLTHFALTDWRTVRRICLEPDLAVGEAYMDGTLALLAGDLYEGLERLMREVLAGKLPTAVARVNKRLAFLMRRLNQVNSARLARRHVQRHYDLDLDMFRLFLDADLQYSCAYFRAGDETLDAAQQAKKRHIAAKLKLDRPGLRVLDIGCGWGGMALTLAQDYGCDVTGITLSQSQLDLARARAEQAGLSGRVRFEMMDYRAVPFTFDRIVSVGMFEHVGVNHYRSFFRTLRACLEPDGVALVHAIGRFGPPGATNAWVRRYIFPGGYVPALSEVTPAVEQSGLLTTDIEILRLHYAETLRHWRTNLMRHRAEVLALRDERFLRMFEFYLAGAEATFRLDQMMVWHLQLTRDQTAVPLTREYITQ